VIPTAFDYRRATSLDDAIAKLGAANGQGKIVAGGHSLIPLMKLRLSEPKVLIDIARIPGLSGIRKTDDGLIEIGANTVHHDVAASPLVQSECPMLAETAADIGDPQVRNRGTIGGSLAHSDPAADYPAAMLALDADIRVKGPKGWRVVKARDFLVGLFTVDLAPDEIIAAVQFKPVRAAAYAKLQQRASRFAIVGVAAALEVANGAIRSARVALTGATTHAVPLSDVEQALTGKKLTKETVETAAEKAGAGLDDVNSDIHASEEYRRAMVPVFTVRALTRAMERAGS
jgi:aerobic carbon-monoxide dehydrogenase medium subunit